MFPLTPDQHHWLDVATEEYLLQNDQGRLLDDTKLEYRCPQILCYVAVNNTTKYWRCNTLKQNR